MIEGLGFVHNWPTSRWSATKKENWFSLNGNGIMSSFLGRQFYHSTLYIEISIYIIIFGSSKLILLSIVIIIYSFWIDFMRDTCSIPIVSFFECVHCGSNFLWNVFLQLQPWIVLNPGLISILLCLMDFCFIVPMILFDFFFFFFFFIVKSVMYTICVLNGSTILL